MFVDQSNHPTQGAGGRVDCDAISVALSRGPIVAHAAEAVVREALRRRVLTETAGARDLVDEFWMPRSNERADLAVIGRWMDGFEIKTDRDSLQRLPRQAVAYGRVFDRCTAVVAEKHTDRAVHILPEWWGIMTAHVNVSVSFVMVRKAHRNREVDADILVRLLWRDEAFRALVSLGAEPDPKASRQSLWQALLNSTTLTQLRALVRRALVSRDPADARIATRRFSALGAVGR
jgi:hypothetical protein